MIFDNLSSKPHPRAAISPLTPYPAAIIPTSFSPPHKPQAFMSLPSQCLCIFYFIYPQVLPQNDSEFICSPLRACQSNLSRGFGFIKCIPHLLAFYSISPTRQILSVKATNDSSVRSASLIIHLTYIYLFLQQVPESRGFSSVPCHLKHCHYQPLHNDIGSTTLLQLGGKLASWGWGLNSSWQRKHWSNWLTRCLQNPKGYPETPGQMWIVCRWGMDGLVWQTTSDKEMCCVGCKTLLHGKQSAQPESRGWLFIERWCFFLFSWKYFQILRLKHSNVYYHIFLQK